MKTSILLLLMLVNLQGCSFFHTQNELMEKTAPVNTHAQNPIKMKAIEIPPDTEKAVVKKSETEKPKKEITKKPPPPPKKVTKETPLSPKIAAVEKPQNKASFSGNIKVLGDNGQLISAEKIIILINPIKPYGHKKKISNTHTINMLNKQYTPSISTISSGENIRFKNNDSVKHNVFSSSNTNSFDLGTYGRGKSNHVTLSQSGIVKVYCNIHPDMVAFVGISPFNYAALSNKKGAFAINNLLAGEYSVHIWSIRGEIKQRITIRKNVNLHKNFTLNTASYKKVQHKNKYGKSYEQSSLFDDEFY